MIAQTEKLLSVNIPQRESEPREDMEPLILTKAYEKWGYDMADHLHGMFAFALWDVDRQQLFQ